MLSREQCVLSRDRELEDEEIDQSDADNIVVKCLETSVPGRRHILIRRHGGESYLSIVAATSLLLKLTEALNRSLDPTPIVKEAKPKLNKAPTPVTSKLEDLA